MASACARGHRRPARGCFDPSSRSFRSRPPRRRSAKAAATWCTSASRTTATSARRCSSSSAVPTAPTTSSTRKARSSTISLHAIGGDLFVGQAKASRRRTRQPGYAYVVFRVAGSEALLYAPQCDDQDKAMLADVRRRGDRPVRVHHRPRGRSDRAVQAARSRQADVEAGARVGMSVLARRGWMRGSSPRMTTDRRNRVPRKRLPRRVLGHVALVDDRRARGGPRGRPRSRAPSAVGWMAPL